MTNSLHKVQQYTENQDDRYQWLIKQGARRDISVEERLTIRQELSVLRRKKKRWKAIMAVL